MNSECEPRREQRLATDRQPDHRLLDSISKDYMTGIEQVGEHHQNQLDKLWETTQRWQQKLAAQTKQEQETGVQKDL